MASRYCESLEKPYGRCPHPGAGDELAAARAAYEEAGETTTGEDVRRRYKLERAARMWVAMGPFCCDLCRDRPARPPEMRQRLLCLFGSTSSALDCTNEYAGSEVSLDEGVDQDDRDQGADHDGHLL